MTRAQARRLIVPSLFAVTALTACVVNLDFSYTQPNLRVESAVAGNAIDTAVEVDLSQQSDISDHISNIQSLSLNTMDLVVTTVAQDNTITSLVGTVSLRPDAATDDSGDVLVGTVGTAAAPFTITTNNTVHLTGSAALDAFVLSTAKGSRKFKVAIKGTTVGTASPNDLADFVVNVSVDMSLGYGT